MGPNLKRSGKSRTTDPVEFRQQKVLNFLNAADMDTSPHALHHHRRWLFGQPLLAREGAAREANQD